MSDRKEGKLYQQFVHGDLVFDAVKQSGVSKVEFDKIADNMLSVKKWIPDTVLAEAKAEWLSIEDGRYHELTDDYSWEALFSKEEAQRQWFHKWFGSEQV